MVSEGAKRDDSKRLLSLVKSFAEAEFSCSDRLIEIIGKIRSNIYVVEGNNRQENSLANLHDNDDILTIHKLYRALILHIGFLLGSEEQISKSYRKWEELLSALLLCLRDIYTMNTRELSKCNTEEELNELFIILPKILRLNTMQTFFDANAPRTVMREEISMCCKQIFESWINAPILLKKVVIKHTTTALENFVLAFLISMYDCNTGNKKDQDSSDDVLDQLRSLCNDTFEFRKLLDVASIAIDSKPSPPENLSPRLTIFYWRCLSCVTSWWETKGGKVRHFEIANSAIDSLIPYCSSRDRTLSRPALACIGRFSHISSCDRCTRLIQLSAAALSNESLFCDGRIVENAEDNYTDSNLVQTLDCLGLCIKRTSATNFIRQVKDWEHILERLASLAENERNPNVAVKATIVLVPLLETLTTSTEYHSTSTFANSMNILMSLMSLENINIVENMVDFLFTVLQNSDTRKLISSSTLLPDLVNVIGELSSKNFFVETSKKARLAHSFSMIIDEIVDLNFLARSNSNLAFLVLLANGSYCEMSHNRVQEISICTIAKLARNPCNRRILAKEPGLLSSLIRYTRLVTEDTEFLRERGVSRKELKNRVFILASAL